MGEPLILDPTSLVDNGPEIHTGSDEPFYGHDCDKCEFLGKWRGEGEGGPNTIFDLYFHGTGGSVDTIIARYGSDGGDYYSGMVFGRRGAIPALTEAYRRAVRRGLVVDSSIPTREQVKAYAEEIRQRTKDYGPSALEELGRELGIIK